MPVNLRVVLGAITAISALVLPGATAAQATTAPRTLEGHASSSLSAPLPSVPVDISPDMSPNVSYCLISVGIGQQTVLNNCDSATSAWNINRISPTDSRGGAWVTIENTWQTLCLDAQDNATGTPNINGDHVNSWPCDGAAQQAWYLWPLANGDCMIINGWDLNHNMVLDARTNSTWNPGIPGDPVQIWTSVGTPQQSWILSEVRQVDANWTCA